MLGGEELLVGMLNGEVAVSMLKQPPHKIFKHPGVCGVVWCGVVWCGVVWCGVVWCGVL